MTSTIMFRPRGLRTIGDSSSSDASSIEGGREVGGRRNSNGPRGHPSSRAISDLAVDKGDEQEKGTELGQRDVTNL